MFKQELRLVKVEKHTKDGRAFPSYTALYDKGDSIGFTDVSFSKDTLKDFIRLCNGKTYVDVILSFGEGKADADKEDAFIADKRKSDGKGGYVAVKDKNGNPIPHIVIRSLSETNLMKNPIRLPQKETKQIYEPKDFFHRSGEKNAVLTNIKDTDLPF